MQAAPTRRWRSGRRRRTRTTRAQCWRSVGCIGKVLGVIQDYVQAHKWLTLAASRGVAAAVQERDALAERMTPEERAAAQNLAKAWRPGTVEDGQTSPAATSARIESSQAPPPRAIREAQELLAHLGYAPGPADGIWGRRTGEAYRMFLGDAGLPAAKTLTPDALHAMRALAKRTGADSAAGRTTVAAGKSARVPSGTGTLRPTPVPRDVLPRAAQAGDIDGLKAALDAGADVDARDRRGWTALMHAANNGYTLLVESLLDARADPDIRAADGATALFAAALQGHAEIVAQLLRAGADESIQGPRGRTPLEVAQAQGYSKMLELPEVVALQEARARDEKAWRAREDAEAFARAKSLDTAQAYVDYRSQWCPQGNFCEESGTRIGELTRARIAGKAFTGINSLGDRQVYKFGPSGEIDGVARPGSWTSNTCSGNWTVEEGKIRARCKWGGGAGWSIIDAALEDGALTGREQYTRDGAAVAFGPKVTFWTWRLSERSEEEVETKRRNRLRQNDGR